MTDITSEELSESVEEKLISLVETIAEENLKGKPMLLENCIYINIKKVVMKQIISIDNF